ncbi:hypothetical protein K504DRAFT_537730 [Pleomassaria siparia CBS 279.74]|uniref:BTB domain-containing protein n=1 Tax=Pleomassaria siparia CBS 279.74 TaxID=1314801 RepID=A0A6G1JVS0_9PLEO|nr:hypothetical protein K504DRAFT_537730 [Pleomassaria siparia CBS 279.74]
MACKSSTSPQPVLRRAETVASSSGTSRPSDRASSLTTTFDRSPGTNGVLIEAEIHSNEDTNTVDEIQFRPFQELTKTMITIECGPKLEVFPVPLGLLQCYSKDVQQLFNDAKALNEDYAKMRNLKRNLKSLLPPQHQMDDYQGKHGNAMAEKAIVIILVCLHKYPLREHQSDIKDFLASVINSLVKINKLLRAPPSNGGIKKRDLPAEDDVRSRLYLLNAEGIGQVTRELHDKLWEIKYTERKKVARDNRHKAAAQNRILLPYHDADTLGYLIRFIYSETLDYGSTAQLCKLYGLAEELGVSMLALRCLTKLSNAALDAIEHANAHGITIRALLDPDSQVSNDRDPQKAYNGFEGVVGIIVTFVLNHQDPPPQLRKIVVDAIVESADLELLADLQASMKPGLARDIMMALMLRWTEAKPYMEVAKEGHMKTQHESEGEEIEVDTTMVEKVSRFISDT